jgi:hypothetical protein
MKYNFFLFQQIQIFSAFGQSWNQTTRMEGAAGKSQTTNVEMFSKFKTNFVNQSFEIYLFWKYNPLFVNFFQTIFVDFRITSLRASFAYPPAFPASSGRPTCSAAPP